MMQTLNDYFFNEIRFKQLLGIVKNTRPDYRRAMCGKSIHGVIYDIARKHNPIDWHQLILELPHVASDGISIAYYRRDSDVGNKVTITRPGKYISRHFPQLQDHIIRDYVSPFIAKVEIIDDLELMIETVINGPHSCMANDSFNIHPYKVYNPEFGWKLAVRKMNNEIVGRALINNNNFVRCYAKSHTSGGYACGDDNILESYLISQGFDRLNAWPNGTKISRIEYGGDIVAPYIDGNKDNLNDRGDYLIICDDGDYEACQTNGFAECKNKCTCSHCGDRVDEDDLHYPGDYSDGICEDCLNANYTFISEARINGRYVGGQYYHDDDVGTTIEGDSFPLSNMSDYYIVELHNGDYTSYDNAICVNDDYYHTDDIGELIVEIGDSCEYELIEDCTKLHDDSYALDDDAQLLHDGQYALIDDCHELHNGDYALIDDAIELHDGQYALIDDAIELHDGQYALIDDAIELHDGQYALESNIGTVVTELIDGTYVLSQLELI
jgi:hypothetical protein